MKYLFFLLLLVADTAIAQDELRSLKDIEAFFSKRTLVPQDAIDSGYNGFVVARFSIADGKVKTPEIVFSDHARFNDAVMNAINLSSGKWGIKAKGDYVVPFYFNIVNVDRWQKNITPPLPQPIAMNKKGVILLKPVMCTTYYIACNFYGPETNLATECKTEGIAY